MLRRAFAVALLVSFLLTPLAAGQGAADPNPQVDEWIEADYQITFQSFTDLELDATLGVHEVEIEGQAYTADEIREAYRGIAKYAGQKQGEAFLGDMEAEVRVSFERALAQTFPDAEREVTRVEIDRATLEDASGTDAYHPAVDVLLEARVAQPREAFGLDTLEDDAVHAAFDAGADLLLDLDLVADAGWRTTYHVAPPEGLAFTDAVPGDVTAAGDARFTVDNQRGTQDATRTVTFTLTNPDAHPPAAERVASHVHVAIENLDLDAGGLPLAIALETRVHAISLADVGADALPDNVRLDVLSAEGLRNLYATGAIDDAHLQSASDTLLDRLRARLTNSFGEDVTLAGGFDAATLQADRDAGVPIVFHADTTATKLVPGAEGRTSVAPVFDAGARVTLSMSLVADDTRDVTFTLTVPDGLAIEAATGGGQVAADGRSVTYAIAAGSAPGDVDVTLAAADAPTHQAENASLEVTIDLYDIDVSVTKAAGGDFGNLLANVGLRGELGVIRIPDAMKTRLPEGVDITYLGADGIRALYAAGYVTEAQVKDLNDELLAQASARLGEALGDEVAVKGGLDEATLTTSDAGVPIVFEAHASIRKALMGGEPQGQAAINLYTAPPQTFNLPRIEGRDTTYTFVLPEGLALVDLDAENAATEQTTQNGRDAFRVSPHGDASDVLVTMAVTSAFVIAKFWPVLLVAGLVLVLLVGGPTTAVVLRRRRRRAAAAEDTGEDGE